MINRILIRIKVVQMLYSYLLTRTDFKINTANSQASDDKKFAYAVYFDLMLLLLELSGYSAIAGRRKGAIDADKKLKKSRVAAALAGDDTIKTYILRGESDMATLLPVVIKLNDKIVNSAVYADFKKRRSPSLDEEVAMWISVFETIIVRDKDFIATLRTLAGFTKSGLNIGLQMFEDTLCSYRDTTDGYAQACNDLERSLDKAYDLYVSMFGLIVTLTREQERRLELAKTKHLATPDDLNPNMRFVENMFVEKLLASPDVERFVDECPVKWETEISLINSLLSAITTSETYMAYMSSPSTDYVTDCEFWREIMRNVVFLSDDLLEVLENKSLFWNDDLQIMGTFVLKTIRAVSNNPDQPMRLLEKYKDEEDATFGHDLFVATVKHREEYRGYIDAMIDRDSWDPDRLVFMDIVIMLTALAEVINYPNIPLAVSMNEYVEIANDYSSAKSGQFINGILFGVVSKLREQGLVMK